MRAFSLLVIAPGLVLLAGCGSKSEPVHAGETPAPAVEQRVALFGPVENLESEVVSFQFARDGIGELLRERLTPSAPAAEPIPYVGEPRPWFRMERKERFVRLELPAAIAANQETRVLAAEWSRQVGIRRSPDVPPLAAMELALPHEIVLPTGPLAFAVGPDPAQPPATELAPPSEQSLTSLPDPTAHLSRQSVLNSIDLQRTEPLPFTSTASVDQFDQVIAPSVGRELSNPALEVKRGPVCW